ncbi:HD domain-containing protein [bacterium]|nr:HD domain-containing protein [candidate division CSSED10-310 bacterium]
MKHKQSTGTNPRRKTLRRQMIFWMVMVTVFPLFILIVGMFYFSYIPQLNSFLDFNSNLLNRHILIEQSSEARLLAKQIGDFMDEITTQGMVIGRTTLLPFLDATEKNRVLSGFLHSYPDIDYIVIRDLQDRVRSTGREEKTFSAQLQGILSDPILFQITLAGEMTFSEPFVLPELQELAMVITQPLLSETGSPMGAMFMQIDLKQVQEFTDEANRVNPGTIYVVDSEGKLVGHVDRVRVLKREDMSDLEIVKNYLIPRITAGSVPYKDKKGRQVQGAYSPVGDLNWGVVTERSQSAAFSPIHEMSAQAKDTMKRMFWATMIGVISAAILAISIGTLLAVRISSPIRTMADGAIKIAKGDFKRRFNVQGAAEIQQLAATLNHMSQAIEQYTNELSRHVRNLRELFKGSVESLTTAIDAKDPYTQGHSRRVTAISLLIGRKLNISENALEELEISAMMHDIGKIGVDDAILKKPGMVTEMEREALQMHPSLGASIMKPIPLLKNMIPGMLHHHERWDGSGYPDGLKGKDIPFYGRIIAVADVFDAMTSDRPYQESYTYEKARDKIYSGKGILYDPDVVDAFLDVFDEICRSVVKERKS